MFKLVAHTSILQKVMKDELEIKGFQLILIQWTWLIKTMKKLVFLLSGIINSVSGVCCLLLSKYVYDSHFNMYTLLPTNPVSVLLKLLNIPCH